MCLKYLADILSEISTWCTPYVPPEPEQTEVINGLLYNWFAVGDARNICADGWHVPTEDNFATLYSNISGTEVEKSEKVCDPSFTYWLSIGDSTNELKFNGRGSGARWFDTGEFTGLKGSLDLWTSTEVDGNNARCYYIVAGAQFNLGWTDKNDGKGIRLVKDSTTLTDGQEGTYTGNDGKIYRTICIGTQEWLADNLCETEFANGDSIPEVQVDGDWIALATAGMCAYNNNWLNVSL